MMRRLRDMHVDERKKLEEDILHLYYGKFESMHSISHMLNISTSSIQWIFDKRGLSGRNQKLALKCFRARVNEDERQLELAI